MEVGTAGPGIEVVECFCYAVEQQYEHKLAGGTFYEWKWTLLKEMVDGDTILTTRIDLI